MSAMQKTTWNSITLLVILTLLLFPSAAFSRTALGPTLIGSLPQNEFADMAGAGAGIGAKFLYYLPSLPVLAFRADVSAVWYGSQESISLTTEYSPEIVAHLKTRRRSYRVALGPHLESPTGSIRPYLAPMIGLYHHRVTEKIDGQIAWQSECVNTMKFGWSLGAGFVVDLTGWPEQNLELVLDIGAKYHAAQDLLGPWPFLDAENRDAEEVVVTLGAMVTF